MIKVSAVRGGLGLLFLLYLFVLVKLVVFKYPIDLTETTTTISLALNTLNSNFVPLKTILNYLGGEPSWSIAVQNLLGNVVLFVPFGVFLPALFQSFNWKYVLLFTFLVSFSLEILQVFYVGTPDVDDVLLNTLGGGLGYIFFQWITKIVRKHDNA
jgi:glycopeptide antibiotics resistance protein